MFVLIAPDKFKGTLSASQVADAMSDAARSLGLDTHLLPLADGGEGIVSVLGGANQESEVTGPLGEKTLAQWRLEKGRAVIEMSSASGLTLVGGPAKNDPVKASSIGTGELIAAAIEAGATRIIVGAGGSASTDGGLGALNVVKKYAPFGESNGIDLIIACDVDTTFSRAAEIFGGQKGASPSQISALSQSLMVLAGKYKSEYGVTVEEIPGSGAAGGFAGGMAALGAKIVNGFNLIADEIDFDGFLKKSDFVLTGEGQLDASSFGGKVVGSVLSRAKSFGIPCGVVAGNISHVAPRDFLFASLVDIFGADRAMAEPASSVKAAARAVLDKFLSHQLSIKE